MSNVSRGWSQRVWAKLVQLNEVPPSPTDAQYQFLRTAVATAEVHTPELFQELIVPLCLLAKAYGIDIEEAFEQGVLLLEARRRLDAPTIVPTAPTIDSFLNPPL